MHRTEDLNWKLKEATYLAPKIKPDCELESFEVGYGNKDSESVGWQNEPDPTMRSLNPFTQARNLAGLKQTDVATKLNIEVVEIIRLEQAIFTYVPEKYVDFYVNSLGLPEYWEAGYRQFQRLLRESAPRSIHGVWEMPPGELSFQRWRLHNWPTLSQMGFCKAFCVHPAGLYAIEKGAKVAVPSDIIVALVEAKIMSNEQARHFAFRIRQAALNDKRKAA